MTTITYKENRQAIMIQRVENGYVIGVVKDNERSGFMNTNVSMKELYICKDIKEIVEKIERIVPFLKKMDGMDNIEDDDY